MLSRYKILTVIDVTLHIILFFVGLFVIMCITYLHCIICSSDSDSYGQLLSLAIDSPISEEINYTTPVYTLMNGDGDGAVSQIGIGNNNSNGSGGESTWSLERDPQREARLHFLEEVRQEYEIKISMSSEHSKHISSLKFRCRARGEFERAEWLEGQRILNREVRRAFVERLNITNAWIDAVEHNSTSLVYRNRTHMIDFVAYRSNTFRTLP